METGKTTRYFKYAIGEIILVVIGILIALQVNDNNEKRKLKSKEHNIVKQLLNDFKKNQDGIEYYKEAYKGALKYIDVILRYTGPNATALSEEVFDSIQSLYTPNVELLYTSDASQSTLNIELLSNNILRQTIKSFPMAYKFYDSYESGLDELIIEQRKLHQKYVPLISREPTYAKRVHFKVDTLGLLRDMQFQNTTVDRLWVTQSAIRELDGLEKFNDSIIKLLEKELKTYD